MLPETTTMCDICHQMENALFDYFKRYLEHPYLEDPKAYCDPRTIKDIHWHTDTPADPTCLPMYEWCKQHGEDSINNSGKPVITCEFEMKINHQNTHVRFTTNHYTLQDGFGFCSFEKIILL